MRKNHSKSYPKEIPESANKLLKERKYIFETNFLSPFFFEVIFLIKGLKYFLVFEGVLLSHPNPGVGHVITIA